MKTTQRRRCTGILTTLGIVLLSACGAGSGDETQSKDLKIGVMLGITGEFSDFAEDTGNAFKMGAETINDSAVLPGGGKLKLVTVDEGNTENCVREANKFVRVDNVDVMIGQSSNCITALQRVAEENQVPVVSHQAGTVRLDTLGGEWLWRTYPSDSAEGVATARYFLKQDAQTAAVLVQKSESTQGIASVFAAAFEAGGGSITKNVAFEGGQSSYQSEIAKALSDDPDVVFVASGEETGSTVMIELNQREFKGKVGVSGDISSDEFLEKVGRDVMAGVCNNRATSDEEDESFLAFNSEFKKRYGVDSYVSIPNAYDTVLLVALAGLQGKSFDGQPIRDNLASVAGPPGVKTADFKEAAELIKAGKEVDFDGASGVLDFDKSGTSKVPESTYCVRNGKWVKVDEFSVQELAEK